MTREAKLPKADLAAANLAGDDRAADPDLLRSQRAAVRNAADVLLDHQPHGGVPPATRHIVVGVSAPSGDPTRHRTFAIRAAYSAAAAGWLAEVDEQDPNGQPQAWTAWFVSEGADRPAPSAAACLGRAVEFVVATVARDEAA